MERIKCLGNAVVPQQFYPFFLFMRTILEETDCEYMIRTYTNTGDTVLDSCMGSGTTGVACMNLGRKFIGIEIDADMYEIASQRIEGTYGNPKD